MNKEQSFFFNEKITSVYPLLEEIRSGVDRMLYALTWYFVDKSHLVNRLKDLVNNVFSILEKYEPDDCYHNKTMKNYLNILIFTSVYILELFENDSILYPHASYLFSLIEKLDISWNNV